MKKILLFALLAAGGSMNAQTTIFEDSFDTYADFIITGIGGWTMIDVDQRPPYGFTGLNFTNEGVAKAFQVFNSQMTTNAGGTITPMVPSATSDWTANTGDKALVCFASEPNAAAPTNNDWAISPQITLAASGNSVSFWAKSCDAPLYGDERFNVYVSTTGTAIADFTKISDDPDTATPADLTYYEYTYDLDAYAGQPVYIAIQCVSQDQFGFMVDDFRVTTTLGLQDFFSQNFAAYPNPTNNVLNVNSKSGIQMDQIQLTDLNGRIVRNVKVGGLSETQINMSDLASGAYFLKVQTANGTGVQKIIRN